jgi:D-alanine-D-alanine ligase
MNRESLAAPSEPAYVRRAQHVAASSVAVVLGGRSSEREVSTWSGDAILRALAAQPEGAGARGPKRVERVEIAADGAWIVGGCSMTAVEALARLVPEHVFFLALHGGQGEDGTLQGLLESVGAVHTGSGVEASALCMNKHLARLALHAEGVRVAEGALVRGQRWRTDRDGVLAEARAFAASGLSVKPNRGGSSVATTLLDGIEGLPAAIETVLTTGDDALVEARIRGAEATCAVLGNRGGPLRALPPVEIVPKAGRFFDYEEKYAQGGALEFCPPRNLTRATVARIGASALAAYRAAGCDGYARIDFMIPRDARGDEGEPVALELNTLPGMTARSLLPQAALAAGLSFRELCLELLALALDRAEARRR